MVAEFSITGTIRRGPSMVGTVFLNRYQAISFLGKGSMGAVYLARHVSKPEEGVVKVVHPHAAKEANFREFFQREIDSLSRLQHPCVVGLREAAFPQPGALCLLMECILAMT